jgi:hypothetical protein
MEQMVRAFLSCRKLATVPTTGACGGRSEPLADPVERRRLLEGLAPFEPLVEGLDRRQPHYQRRPRG